MATKKVKEQMDPQQNVAEAVSKTEEFLEANKKWIYGCLIALLVVAAAIVLWTRFYVQPRKAEAAEQMFHAEWNFAEGNYDIALKGDDNYPGFEEIASTYGNKAGKAIWMYAGICSLQIDEYEDAIGYLKKYSGKDKIMLGRAQAAIGDAYVGLENYEEALKWFEKAAATSSNAFSAGYLLKAGVTAEELGDSDKALGFYKEIKDKYPQAPEARDIDKYISRIETAE
ncbi:MAG: tetratricopeptide repeat protein [Bacteroidales bacterium]|nr:tetratricopeptide repeat protein [Bacteroidales bacterium]